MRKYTSFYWLGAEVERTVFEAESDGAALREHDEMGWNAYDDRVLLAGDVSAAEVERKRSDPDGAPEKLYRGWKLDRY